MRVRRRLPIASPPPAPPTAAPQPTGQTRWGAFLGNGDLIPHRVNGSVQICRVTDTPFTNEQGITTLGLLTADGTRRVATAVQIYPNEQVPLYAWPGKRRADS